MADNDSCIKYILYKFHYDIMLIITSLIQMTKMCKMNDLSNNAGIHGSSTVVNVPRRASHQVRIWTR